MFMFIEKEMKNEVLISHLLNYKILYLYMGSVRTLKRVSRKVLVLLKF